MKTIYLDHAAATPLDDEVLAAMRPYFAEQFYNPSGVYTAARQVRNDLDKARTTVARYLGSRPAEIVFTAGGTEANNLAISGIMQLFPEARVLTSVIEHDSVLLSAKRFDHGLIGVTEQGIIDMAAMGAAIDDRTVLVSVMYANNEIGAIQPIRDIGRQLHEIRRDRQARGIALPLYYHSDAAQATNYLDLQAARLGVDLMTLNGGKIYGPKQIGALYVRGGVGLQPLIVGGGQEHAIRSGTENVPAIIGFAKALEIAQDSRHDESRRLAGLQDYFFKEIYRRIPTVMVNGSVKQRIPNNLHIALPGQDNERLLYQLDDAGIMAAAGSACSASSETASHVLTAIGLPESDARASLRLTMGRATDKTDLETTIGVLQRLLEKNS